MSKENRGALFKNDRKETDSHPDYKGSLNVEGQEYWISAWLETSQSGTKYMSLSVQYKEKEKVVDVPQEIIDGKEINLDDIPF